MAGEITVSPFLHILVVSAAVLAAATIALGMALVARKGIIEFRQMRISTFAGNYRDMIAGILLEEGPEGDDSLPQWTIRHRSALDALVAEIRGRGSLHRRTALFGVLVDMSRTLCGEPLGRVGMLYERCGFVRQALRALRSRRWWVRARACRDLGTMRSRRALYALLDRLHDPSDEVRQEASLALVAIVGTGEAMGAILHEVGEINPWFALRLSVAVNAAAGEALEPLVDALFSPSASVRRFAVIVLGEVKDPSTVPDLLEALHPAYVPNRAEILVTLGKIGDARALPALLAGVDHPDARVRLAALAGIGDLGAPAAAGRLTLAVRSAPLAESQEAAASLVCLLEAFPLEISTCIHEAGLSASEVLQEALDNAGTDLPEPHLAARGAA
jgi:HEAT repeat protein